MQEARSAGAKNRAQAAGIEKKTKAQSAEQGPFEHFQRAVQLMQEGKYDKARDLFEQLAGESVPELADRSRVYLAVCARYSSRQSLNFSTMEERYDYAVSLLNQGQYEDARDQFEGMLERNGDADYAHYGLAVLNSMTGQAEECLEHLARAIELNSRNRLQARSDADFVDMADDPRFTELLYPEAQ
ncbi:TPR end-of-group domain-containing protein [Silvibacterium sp.]|uniref:TPR end-of-group domain-containing protein n=1 Tax=Silvibacterium sp. TaxID=1964179 RepID=UPI0039E61E7A